MKRLFYVLGGDAERVRRVALEGAPPGDVHAYPFPHWKFPNGICFGWMDTPNNVRGQGYQAQVLDWLKRAEPDTALVTGSYLANDLFLDLTRQMGYEVTVAIIESPGGESIATWDLAGRHVEPHWWLNGSEPVSVIAARLRLHPVLETLRRPCLRCGADGSQRDRRTS